MRCPASIRLLAAACLLAGCSNSGHLTAVARGRRVYQANCVVCHNPDPAKPGGVGPAIAGSSRALIAARVLHATYPPGYAPKRPTKIMHPFPYLANRIDDLAAFLHTAKNREVKTSRSLTADSR